MNIREIYCKIFLQFMKITLQIYGSNSLNLHVPIYCDIKTF